MKRYFLFILLFVTQLFSATEVFQLNSYVTDKVKLLTQEQKQSLEKKLETIEKSSKDQIAILIIDTIDGYTLEEYSIAVASKNKLGTKELDNGVLLLFVMGQREVRIEVGYGLEGSLTDAISGRIIREQIVPNFKKQQFFNGINLAVEKINSTISGSNDNLQDKKSTQENSSTNNDVDESYEVKNTNMYDEYFDVFAVIVAVISIGLLIRSVISISKFRLLKSLEVYSFVMAGFLAVAVFVFLLDVGVAAALVAGVIVAIVIDIMFNYILAFIISILIGNYAQVKFIFSIYSFKRRDKQIDKTINVYYDGKNSLNKYKKSGLLYEHYDTFRSVSKVVKERSFWEKELKECEFNKKLFINMYKVYDELEYELVVICYNKNNYPKIYLARTSRDEILSLETKTIDEIKTLLQTNVGLWDIIDDFSFARKGSDSSSGGSSSSSGGFFSGRGGSFGGGGSSGKW